MEQQQQQKTPIPQQQPVQQPQATAPAVSQQQPIPVKKKRVKKDKRVKTKGKSIQSKYIVMGIICTLLVITLFSVLATETVKRKTVVLYKQNEETFKQLSQTQAVPAQSLTVLNKSFATSENVIELINTLEGFKPYFESFQLEFKSDSPQGDKSPKYLPLSLRVSGSLQNAQNLLSAMLKLPLVYEVETVEINSETTFNDTVSMNISGKLYVSDTFK